MSPSYTYRTTVQRASYWGDSWEAIDVVAFRTKRQGLAVWRYRATTFNRQWSSKAFLTRECAVEWLHHSAILSPRSFRVEPDVLTTGQDIAAAFAAINSGVR
jgi:hypothetical protein